MFEVTKITYMGHDYSSIVFEFDTSKYKWCGGIIRLYEKFTDVGFVHKSSIDAIPYVGGDLVLTLNNGRTINFNIKDINLLNEKKFNQARLNFAGHCLFREIDKGECKNAIHFKHTFVITVIPKNKKYIESMFKYEIAPFNSSSDIMDVGLFLSYEADPTSKTGDDWIIYTQDLLLNDYTNIPGLVYVDSSNFCVGIPCNREQVLYKFSLIPEIKKELCREMFAEHIDFIHWRRQLVVKYNLYVDMS